MKAYKKALSMNMANPIRTLLLLAALLFGSAVAADTKVSLHQDPDTRLITWTAEDNGITLEFIQLIPDFVRAIYSKHNFPDDEIEDIAAYCVFGTILKNTADVPMQYDVSDWRYVDASGSHPVKTKTEWLEQWRTAGVTFSWTLLPDKGNFQVGDWQQGFTTVKTDRNKPFTFIFKWTLDGVQHTGRIENMHCAPEQPPL
jgi:hypothetical protein